MQGGELLPRLPTGRPLGPDAWRSTASTAAGNPHQGSDGLARLCDRILADVAGPADREDDICLLAIQTS
jgi:hypothetical protein